MCGARARRIATSPGTSKGRFSLPGFFLFLFLGFFQRLFPVESFWRKLFCETQASADTGAG